jgi:hypothetical protein
MGMSESVWLFEDAGERRTEAMTKSKATHGKQEKQPKCGHKRLIMATADYVIFEPDQEPFEFGKIECSGVSQITVPHMIVNYCPECKRIVSCDCDGECQTSTCTREDRCNGHE